MPMPDRPLLGHITLGARPKVPTPSKRGSTGGDSIPPTSTGTTIEVSNLINQPTADGVTTSTATLTLPSDGLWGVRWDARFVPQQIAVAPSWPPADTVVVDQPVVVSLDGDALDLWAPQNWGAGLGGATPLLRGADLIELTAGDHDAALTISWAGDGDPTMDVVRFMMRAYRWVGDLPA